MFLFWLKPFWLKLLDPAFRASFPVLTEFTLSEFAWLLLAMSDSVAPRPLTRSASKQNYSAQPVTAIAAVRDKFEKHRGHIKSKSDVLHASGMEVEKHELSDDAFADSPTVWVPIRQGGLVRVHTIFPRSRGLTSIPQIMISTNLFANESTIICKVFPLKLSVHQ